MAKYRKTALVDAVQYEGDFRCLDIFSINEVKDFKVCHDEDKNEYLIIPSLEGDHRCNKGDYVCRGVEGEYWCVRKDIFEKTYEKVEVA